jgi:hypothetical protein
LVALQLLDCAHGVFIAQHQDAHAEDVFLRDYVTGNVPPGAHAIFDMVRIVIIDFVESAVLAEVFNQTSVVFRETVRPRLARTGSVPL